MEIQCCDLCSKPKVAKEHLTLLVHVRKEKEKTTPFGVNSMSSQVLYQVVQDSFMLYMLDNPTLEVNTLLKCKDVPHVKPMMHVTHGSSQHRVRQVMERTLGSTIL